jgi:hypothetical protein
VTVEAHPHNGIPHLNIHPCKHASVMKKIVDQLTEREREREREKKTAQSAAADGKAPYNTASSPHAIARD